MTEMSSSLFFVDGPAEERVHSPHATLGRREEDL